MSSKKDKAPKGLTKSQLLAEIASKTQLQKNQISEIFDLLFCVVQQELKHNRSVTIPNLVKISLKARAATPSRQGKNPFTGAPMTIKAKPAGKVVKVRAVKSLKELGK